jgi:hypothetical protein
MGLRDREIAVVLNAMPWKLRRRRHVMEGNILSHVMD